MEGFSRTLKYSLYQGVKYAVISLLASCIYSLYFQFMKEEAFTVSNLLSNFGKYFVFVSVFFVIIFGMVGAAVNVQEQISFGCKRMHAALSISLSGIIASVIIIAALVIFYAVVPMFSLASRAYDLLHMTEILFAASGLTALFSAFVMRFGRVAYIVCIMIICALNGAVFSLWSSDAKGIDFTQFEVALAIVPIVLIIVGNIAVVSYAKHIEIKA